MAKDEARDNRLQPSPRSPFVSVAVRIRPSFSDEPVTLWYPNEEREGHPKRLCCHRGYVLEEYEFSRVFGPDDDNRRLFADLQAEALTESVFSGVNETLFAYGQTGSGKTHTIFGSATEAGLLQLFVQQIFAARGPFQADSSSVHLCCYEVLGETLTDLLDSSALLEEGELQEDDIMYDELYIKTQKCRYQICHVRSAEQCLSLLHLARRRRTSGVSSQNTDSSRSHAVVHLFVQTPRKGGASIGTLTLVDLAGTEKEQENPSEQGRKSARLLNTSLCSLNRLLRKLQMGCLHESERRQSVLNKCLWDYLRPGCGIALIFCVSPLLQHRGASLSTLSMAMDSKAIHSQRKSQYIPVSPRARSPSPTAGGPKIMGPVTPRAGDRTPRRRCNPAEEPVIDVAGTPANASNFRRKLERNARRYERLRQEVERAHEELANDNQSLKRECESLRALFVRQQQQHIAFWSGPFLEMLGDKQPQAHAMAQLAVSNAQEAIAAVRMDSRSRPWDVGALDLEASSRLVDVPPSGTDDTAPPSPSSQPDSMERLRSELDYWRQMALSLQRQLQKPGRRSSKATPETCSSSRRSESEEQRLTATTEGGSESIGGPSPRKAESGPQRRPTPHVRRESG